MLSFSLLCYSPFCFVFVCFTFLLLFSHPLCFHVNSLVIILCQSGKGEGRRAPGFGGMALLTVRCFYAMPSRVWKSPRAFLPAAGGQTALKELMITLMPVPVAGAGS